MKLKALTRTSEDHPSDCILPWSTDLLQVYYKYK